MEYKVPQCRYIEVLRGIVCICESHKALYGSLPHFDNNIWRITANVYDSLKNTGAFRRIIKYLEVNPNGGRVSKESTYLNVCYTLYLYMCRILYFSILGNLAAILFNC